jgi:hypothetical protein
VEESPQQRSTNGGGVNRFSSLAKKGARGCASQCFFLSQNVPQIACSFFLRGPCSFSANVSHTLHSTLDSTPLTLTHHTTHNWLRWDVPRIATAAAAAAAAAAAVRYDTAADEIAVLRVHHAVPAIGTPLETRGIGVRIGRSTIPPVGIAVATDTPNESVGATTATIVIASGAGGSRRPLRRVHLLAHRAAPRRSGKRRRLTRDGYVSSARSRRRRCANCTRRRTRNVDGVWPRS